MFRFKATSFHRYCPNLCEKRLPRHLSTLPKTFYPVVQTKKQKSELGFMTPTVLPGEALGSLSGYAWSQMGGLVKVLFINIGKFSDVLALGDNLMHLSSPGNLPGMRVS